MKVVFGEFDGKKFAKVECATCHGKDAKANKFKMPSSDITPLPPTPEAFKAALATKADWPKWAKFMGEKVQPQMAALLGKPSFDFHKPDPAAFSCQGCHTLAAK
jgi:mono/diheme cytochrome c family protein